MTAIAIPVPVLALDELHGWPADAVALQVTAEEEPRVEVRVLLAPRLTRHPQRRLHPGDSAGLSIWVHHGPKT